MSAHDHLQAGQFPSERVFHYEVQYAPDHAEMSAGRSQTANVSVMAKDETEANLLAAQMSQAGHAIRHLGERPTKHGEHLMSIPTGTKRVG